MSESRKSHSYCPAKWTYLSLKVDSGENHSCHYPPFHKVSLKEIRSNLSSIHNSAFKLKQRENMLAGVRPKECHYCWSLEDKGLKSPRYDHLKNEKEFNYNKFNGYPKYLEISFSKICQMKCLYCNPQTSSAIYNEYQSYGPYLYEDYYKEASKEEKNEYSEAFWSWFLLAYPHLEDLRISGGEPFLSKDLHRLIEFIDKNPMKHLKLSINSNLSLPLAVISPIVDKISTLIDTKKIFSCTYFVSMDSLGKAAEYIRYGIDLQMLHNNIKYILSNTYGHVVVMNTFNILSIPGLFNYLNEVTRLDDNNRLFVSFSMLEYPHFLSARMASEFEIKVLEKELEKIIKSDLCDKYGEVVRDIVSDLKSNKSKSLFKSILKQEFYLFIREYDKRRNTDFNKTFPQLIHLNQNQSFIVKALCQCKIALYKLIKKYKEKLI